MAAKRTQNEVTTPWFISKQFLSWFLFLHRLSSDCDLKVSTMSVKSEPSYTSPCPINLDHLRSIIKDLMERQELKSALFMADKVVDLSDSNPSDVLTLAQCLYRLKEYHRAIHCIKQRKLHEKSLDARHLVAKCHVSNILTNQIH